MLAFGMEGEKVPFPEFVIAISPYRGLKRRAKPKYYQQNTAQKAENQHK